jgi:hypothetical protein
MWKIAQTILAPPERKLYVASVTALCILIIFGVTVYHPPAIEAMKVACEWLVFLAASFMGGNALTAFANRGQTVSRVNTVKTTTSRVNTDSGENG